MTDNIPLEVLDRLRAVALSLKPLRDSMSETARLRHAMDEVEGAFIVGISRQAVLEILQSQGEFKMTMQSFKSALRRIRQEKQ